MQWNCLGHSGCSTSKCHFSVLFPTVIQDAVGDDTQETNLVGIDERTWNEIAKGQIVDVGRLDLVVHIGLRA